MLQESQIVPLELPKLTSSFGIRRYSDRQQPCGECDTSDVWRTEELAVFGIGEGGGCQCDDVFRGCYCLCEWDEGERVSDRAVPQHAGDSGYAVVK